jgi:uncharacterized protein
MAHQIVHFEIAGKDAKKTQQFYSQLFDWQLDTQMMGEEYGMVQGGEGGIGGGIMASPTGQPYVTVYVSVDDLAASLAKAESLGAKTCVPPTEIPADGGSFAMFTDPDGNMVGIYSNPNMRAQS